MNERPKWEFLPPEPAETVLDKDKLEKSTVRVQGMREAQKTILEAEASLHTSEETPAETWEEQTAAMRKAQMKETPPEEWEAFGEEAMKAKKNAEDHGWTVTGAPQQKPQAPATEKTPEKPLDVGAQMDEHGVVGEDPRVAEVETVLKNFSEKNKTKTEGAPEPKILPEQQRTPEEKKLEAARASVLARSAEIAKNTPPQLLGLLDRVTKGYKELHWTKKIAIAAALSGATIVTAATLGPTAGLIAALVARAPAFASGYLISEAVLTRKNWVENETKRRLTSVVGGFVWAATMGAVGKWAGSYIHEWWAGPEVAPKITATLTPAGTAVKDYSIFTGPHATDAGIDPRTEGVPLAPATPEVSPSAPISPEAPAHAGTFSKLITVTDADSKKGLWGILERKLTENGTLTKSTPAMQRNILLDSLEKKLRGLGAEKLQELGFRPDQHGRIFIDVIRPGEKLDLSILNDGAAAAPVHSDIPLPPVRPDIAAPTTLEHPVVKPFKFDGGITLDAHAQAPASAPATPEVVSHNVATRVVGGSDVAAIPSNAVLEAAGNNIFIPESSIYNSMMNMKAAEIANLNLNTKPYGITNEQLTAVQNFLTQWKNLAHAEYGNRALSDIYNDTRKIAGEMINKTPWVKEAIN